MRIKLEVEWGGQQPGAIIVVEKGLGDALLHHRRPPVGVEVGEKGKVMEGRKRLGPKEVK
jgi:hypothetical protein